MEMLELLAIVAIGILVVRWASWLKGIPVKKTTALVLAIVIGLGAAYNWNWFNLKTMTQQAVPEIGPAPIVVTPALFEAEGSETDANLVYDATQKLFTLSFYENWLGGKVVSPTALGTEITSVTLSITLFDVSPSSGDNVARTTTIKSSTPTYLDENSTRRSPVDKDTSLDQWKVALTPTGGTARNEKNTMSVPAGGSKAMSIVVSLDSKDCRTMDNFDSYDLIINTAGGDFRLRIIKTGVDHTA